MSKAMPLTAVLVAGALPLAGCNFMASGGGALLGNLFVLAVTVGIFFGTLGLGRARPSPSTSSADRSQSEQRRT